MRVDWIAQNLRREESHCTVRPCVSEGHKGTASASQLATQADAVSGARDERSIGFVHQVRSKLAFVRRRVIQQRRKDRSEVNALTDPTESNRIESKGESNPRVQRARTLVCEDDFNCSCDTNFFV